MRKKKIGDSEKEDFEGQISFQEATSFLKNMTSYKSPVVVDLQQNFIKSFGAK